MCTETWMHSCSHRIIFTKLTTASAAISSHCLPSLRFFPLSTSFRYRSRAVLPLFRFCHRCSIKGRRRRRMGECGGSKGCDVVVGDVESLDRKIEAIRMGGPQKLQVIADFDATLTRFLVNGKRGQTSHGLLQQDTPEYNDKRQKLYEHYHPLEFSPSIPIEEKTKLMEEWWGKTHALLVEGGLTYDSISRSVSNANIAFRDGVIELFQILEERGVPVLIFSAGLADIIEEVLRQKLHRSFKNIKIVSNHMDFDDAGFLVAFKGKIIHSLNKNEHALDMASPLHEQLGDTDSPADENDSVKMRTNVILLGDHIGDLGMSDGLKYDTRISVGFLNHNIEGSIDSYRKAFDLVYLNDAPMLGVVDLVRRLLPAES